MADTTPIEWTDATWNIVTGCSVVSPGCTNCYAMRLAGTRLQHHPSRAGLTVDSKAGPVWNGQVRFNAEWLTQPLRWTRPRMIFVAAHGDLFHDGVTDDQLDQIFAVMALCPRHVFQILTKRPERMRAYLTGLSDCWRARLAVANDPGSLPISMADVGRALGIGAKFSYDPPTPAWPLPNVWLGVSVEDQTRADERIPILLDTPAAVRWISAEPLLGPVDLGAVRAARLAPEDADDVWTFDALAVGDYYSNHLPSGLTEGGDGPDRAHRLDWVVIGGESGPGVRPMHPDWARQLRDQCAAAGVPFLFKQWGAWAPRDEWRPGVNAPAMVAVAADGGRVPDDVAPQDVGGHRMARVGKKASGRHLDGVLHDGFPGVR